MKFLYHPDTVLTPSDLETLAFNILSDIPILEVESCGFESVIIRKTLLQAAFDQKSKAVLANLDHVARVPPTQN